ncbi:MAG: hypothetical protein A2939_04260 [Parcubacteria group bacterium RIFCSPLOWO2_01_FULL_48_18]|nr:MAG: hypothetical protein A2939_04260 [Parcubacteria group bacterium RIFCSPLOWO2_01_FULL_48_18]OHB23741.1 MAG: hypothetical protein A3J67_05090 [Parcubacteria group bacterium RIFCSPHIGHO2_02_FULL_48_10b]
MELTFHGGARMVTGANYLLAIDNARGETTYMLVDCGLSQGSSYCERMNFSSFPYDPKTIKALLVTHAHIDHTGRIPKLYAQGFRGKIYSTAPTKDFAEYLLIDSEHILRKEAEKHHKPPLYTIEDVRGALDLWECVDYHQKVFFDGGASVEFFDAGHILGSSIVVVEADGQKIVFSGDLGNYPAPIIRETETVDRADYCLIESVYGDRLHELPEKRRETLEDVIEETVKAGGVLMIPAFALERTQELLYELNELVENGRIPKAPIFVDSPLAIKLTTVYKKYENYFNEVARKIIESGDKLFNFPGLKTTLTTEESKMINEVPPPKVIVAGAGMSQAGRILHHERRYLPDPKSAILFIGYQGEGSMGRMILDGAKEVTIMGEKVPVRCRVINVSGYSAHADQQRLIDWLIPMHQSLKKIFVVQGEEKPAQALAQRIKDELGVPTLIPKLGEVVKL